MMARIGPVKTPNPQWKDRTLFLKQDVFILASSHNSLSGQINEIKAKQQLELSLFFVAFVVYLTSFALNVFIWILQGTPQSRNDCHQEHNGSQQALST